MHRAGALGVLLRRDLFPTTLRHSACRFPGTRVFTCYSPSLGFLICKSGLVPMAGMPDMGCKGLCLARGPCSVPNSCCESDWWLSVPWVWVPGPLYLCPVALNATCLQTTLPRFTSSSDLSPEHQGPAWHPLWTSPGHLKLTLTKAKCPALPCPHPKCSSLPLSPCISGPEAVDFRPSPEPASRPGPASDGAGRRRRPPRVLVPCLLGTRQPVCSPEHTPDPAASQTGSPQGLPAARRMKPAALPSCVHLCPRGPAPLTSQRG